MNATRPNAVPNAGKHSGLAWCLTLGYRRAKTWLGRRVLMPLAEFLEWMAWDLITCEDCGRSTTHGEPCITITKEARHEP